LFFFVLAVYPGVGVSFVVINNRVFKIAEIAMKIHSCRWTAVGITFLFILFSVVNSGIAAADHKKDASANCDIQAGACVLTLEEGRVTLEILPRPVTAMTDLTFQVILENILPEGEVGIDLGMPGMSMGPNHVTLEKTPEGVYTGTGVIVRCPSGRTIWQADVSVPGTGSVAFTFDVVY